MLYATVIKYLKAIEVVLVQTLAPKITEAGVVMVHRDGTPVMVYATGACPDEMAEWEKSHALKEKRRREREAYQAAINVCGDGQALVCVSRGATKCISNAGQLDSRCACECASPRDVFRGVW